MARIAIVCPVSSLTEEQICERERLLRRVCEAETDICFCVCPEGPASIESRHDEELATPCVIKQCIRVEQDGYDAAVVWCAADPGVPAAREMVKIPVVGPGESAFLLAYGLAENFSVVVPEVDQGQLTADLAKRLGISSKLKSIRGIGMSVLEMRRQAEKMAERIAEAAKTAVHEDGAHAIVLGCLGMIGTARRIMKMVDVPMIDPAETAILLAESLLRLKLTYSRRTYPTSS